MRSLALGALSCLTLAGCALSMAARDMGVEGDGGTSVCAAASTPLASCPGTAPVSTFLRSTASTCAEDPYVVAACDTFARREAAGCVDAVAVAAGDFFTGCHCARADACGTRGATCHCGTSAPCNDGQLCVRDADGGAHCACAPSPLM